MIAKCTKWGIIILSLAASFVLIYLYHDKIIYHEVKFSSLDNTIKKKPHPLRKNKVVITDVYMGLGEDSSIWIQLATPYKNSKQKSELWEYSSIIKNDFLLNIEAKKLKQWARHRDYRAVKKYYLNIVNKYVKEPINTVYLNEFFMNG